MTSQPDNVLLLPFADRHQRTLEIWGSTGTEYIVPDVGFSPDNYEGHIELEDCHVFGCDTDHSKSIAENLLARQQVRNIIAVPSELHDYLRFYSCMAEYRLVQTVCVLVSRCLYQTKATVTYTEFSRLHDCSEYFFRSLPNILKVTEIQATESHDILSYDVKGLGTAFKNHREKRRLEAVERTRELDGRPRFSKPISQQEEKAMRLAAHMTNKRPTSITATEARLLIGLISYLGVERFKTGPVSHEDLLRTAYFVRREHYEKAVAGLKRWGLVLDDGPNDICEFDLSSLRDVFLRPRKSRKGMVE